MDTCMLFLFIIVILGLIGPNVAEYCTEHYVGPSGHTTRTIHCSFGCCGDYYDQYCCVSSTGFIVGLVFAGIFTISVIIAVVCCCIKHKGQRGRIIQPTNPYTGPHHNTQNVFIVPTNGPQPPPYTPGGNSTMYPHAPPAYYPTQGGYTAAIPPAYSSSMAPPPAYSAEGPKYPPTYQSPNPFAAAAAGSSGN